MTADNLCRVARRQAAEQPDRTAFVHLSYGGGNAEVREEVSYGALYRRASQFADQVADAVAPSDRVLLLHSTGGDFVVELLGCLLAGAVPVPAPEPRPPYSRAGDRLARLVEDGAVTAVAAARGVSAADLAAIDPKLARLAWLAEPPPDPGGAVRDDHPGLAVGRDEVAYLQYTSGSTGMPRGIQITHANVLDQAAAFARQYAVDDGAVLVDWLPFFHDMGLVFTVLTPLVQGTLSVTMPPYAFIRSPVRWLRALSDFGGTHAAAPNFAYDLCVQRTTEAERDGLRLDRWKVAFNGSEPVRAQTIDRFVAAFGPYGFRPNAMQPSYGLAEATLLVTAGRVLEPPCRRALDPPLLRAGTAQETPGGSALVSCGRPADGLDVRVVDPWSSTELPDGRIGELWVAGWAVAAGIHGRPIETGADFGARVTGGPDRDFLRTGDLGFRLDSEFYITGRAKDVIVVRGENYYPEDLERAAEEEHPMFRAGCSAAFALDAETGESVGLVCEIRGRWDEPDLAAAAAAVQRRITEEFGIRVGAVVLVPPGGVPKTSSGKRRRDECGRRLASGRLDVRYRTASEPARALSARAVRPVLRLLVGRIVGCPVDEVGDRVPFAEYGLDSQGAHELSGELERLLGTAVPPSLVFDHPTVSGLAAALESQVGRVQA